MTIGIPVIGFPVASVTIVDSLRAVVENTTNERGGITTIEGRLSTEVRHSF